MWSEWWLECGGGYDLKNLDLSCTPLWPDLICAAVVCFSFLVLFFVLFVFLFVFSCSVCWNCTFSWFDFSGTLLANQNWRTSWLCWTERKKKPSHNCSTNIGSWSASFSSAWRNFARTSRPQGNPQHDGRGVVDRTHTWLIPRAWFLFTSNTSNFHIQGMIREVGRSEVCSVLLIKCRTQNFHFWHSVKVNFWSVCHEFRTGESFVGCLLACLTSQQQASVSQGRIGSDNFTCWHTEIQAADQTFYLTQSQYTDTGLTSPSADSITPGTWQGSHCSANF